MNDKIEIISNNRKAFHSYTIIEKYESGIILLGSEVKSLREKKLNLKDIGGITFNLDLHSIHHEKLTSRIYIS